MAGMRAKRQHYEQIDTYLQHVGYTTMKFTLFRKGEKGKTIRAVVFLAVLIPYRIVSIGFSSSKAGLEKLPGWEPDSWGFHSDDGKTYSCGSPGGKSYSEPYNTGDVIGCGINFRTQEAFFTKNGNFLGQ